MVAARKGKYLTKTVSFGSSQVTLFSLDGNTWSTHSEELSEILERHEHERQVLHQSISRSNGKESDDGSKPGKYEPSLEKLEAVRAARSNPVRTVEGEVIKLEKGELAENEPPPPDELPGGIPKYALAAGAGKNIDEDEEAPRKSKATKAATDSSSRPRTRSKSTKSSTGKKAAVKKTMKKAAKRTSAKAAAKKSATKKDISKSSAKKRTSKKTTVKSTAKKTATKKPAKKKAKVPRRPKSAAKTKSAGSPKARKSARPAKAKRTSKREVA